MALLQDAAGALTVHVAHWARRRGSWRAGNAVEALVADEGVSSRFFTTVSTTAPVEVNGVTDCTNHRPQHRWTNCCNTSTPLTPTALLLLVEVSASASLYSHSAPASSTMPAIPPCRNTTAAGAPAYPITERM